MQLGCRVLQFLSEGKHNVVSFKVTLTFSQWYLPDRNTSEIVPEQKTIDSLAWEAKGCKLGPPKLLIREGQNPREK